MRSHFPDLHRGFVISQPSARHWAPLFEEWMLVVERFSRVAGGGDSPFGYRERAGVGLLAAAAWRCGFVALNEFDHEKITNGRSGRGRADLIIHSEWGTDIVEAKFDWLQLGNGLATKLEKLTSIATNDVSRSYRREEHDLAIGIGIGATFLDKEDIPNFEEKLKASIESCQAINLDILAYCFPQLERKTPTPEGNLTPGVFIGGRLLHPPKK